MDTLRSLGGALRNVGLIMNVSETKLSTTQAQPPEHVWLDLQTKIDVIRTFHTWLRWRPCLSGGQGADINFHLSAAACAFWATTCDKHAPIDRTAHEIVSGRCHTSGVFWVRASDILSTMNFRNSLWNGDDYCVLCWVPSRDWIGACTVGLRHVFASVGNSFRTPQLCRPDLGSGASWNGSRSAPAGADHKILMHAT